MQSHDDSLPDSISDVTFRCASLQELPLERLRQTLARYNIIRISDLFPRDEIRTSLLHMTQTFDSGRDKKHDPADTEIIRTNFQKLQIGANSGINSLRTLGRFMRVIYNPIDCEDVLNMREHFIRLARLRNLIYGLPMDFAIYSDENNLWTCNRIQQYPRGGGFMVPHRDQYSQIVSVESGLEYYQLLLLLSEKSTDYLEGGGYIQTPDSRFNYESDCISGDVIIYNGKSMHGVADIDPLETLDLSRLTGRSVAISSLFKTLNKGNDYARLAERSRILHLQGQN